MYCKIILLKIDCCRVRLDIEKHTFHYSLRRGFRELQGQNHASDIVRLGGSYSYKMLDAPIIKRKSAPKGRSGCSTCKSRHVRCDESKPRCTPCQKSSRHCEYSADPVRPCHDQLKVVMWQPHGLAVQRVSPTPSQTSDEGRSFDFFRSKVAANLGGFFDSSFWTRDVLQAAQHEASIRHAVVALASLAETWPQTKRGSERANRNEKDDENGRERSFSPSRSPGSFAIRQYAKAISILNQKTQDSKESSPETVLISCAIFICFEMLQNNHESTLRQMSSGVFVFYEWYSKRRREAEIRAPRLAGLAYQLQQTFGRLLLQIVLFVDTKPQEWQFTTPALRPPVPPIPSKFESIDEARDCLDSYLCSAYHGLLTSQLQGLKDRRAPGLCEKDASRQCYPIGDGHPFPAGTSSFVSTGDRPLHEWALAFAAFIADQKTRLSSKEQQAAVLLQIQHTSGSILASAGIFNQETTFDSFEHSFSRIVSLASRLISDAGENPRDSESTCPAFDMGILPPLYFVASRCRHPTIRRQALHLLRKGPSQEGIWHSEMLSNIAERIMDLEEADCMEVHTSADVPAFARISVLNATIDSAQRVVALHCCRPSSRDSERTHVLHESVAY